MVKISLVLCLTSIGMALANVCRDGSCSTLPTVADRHQRHPTFEFGLKECREDRRSESCEESSFESESRFSESSCSSSDSCDRRPRRRHRRREDSCSSSSEKRCPPIVVPPLCPIPPMCTPLSRCDAILESLFRDMDAALIAFLKNFEIQYRQQVTSFFSNVSSEVTSFNPMVPTFDYVGFVATIAAALPSVPLPVNLAAELAAIQTSAVNGVIANVQNVLGALLGNLLSRVNDLCLNELLSFVNSAQFAGQITAALNALLADVTPAITAMVNAQVALLAGLDVIPDALLATLTATLQGNATNVVSALTAAINALLTAVTTLITSLTSALNSMVATQVKAFQNLAISKINGIVTAIFGTVGVPAPIPPVV